ncbi:hypothetical protein D3OALGA1CA_3980 [Olavius algarvensis associated proteobacterium Delta 3]|nr:hypothetical protein D3OALGB2SA_3378 [Olavius algarvensis associated proteobacterium Delta 3]CAB5143179.1 hypothetical protein D3OALGA1CA_3980 [Olavius algarvensis associated proteobacterium Delta 3]
MVFEELNVTQTNETSLTHRANGLICSAFSLPKRERWPAHFLPEKEKPES